MRNKKSIVDLMRGESNKKLDLPKIKEDKQPEPTEIVYVFCKKKAGRMYLLNISVCENTCPEKKRAKCKEYWEVMKEKFGKERPVKRKYRKRKKII